MSDLSEAEHWKAVKASVVEGIRAKGLAWYTQQYASRLSFDSRLWSFCENVLTYTDDHNLYEILAVLRFLCFLDKYDFREKRVRRFYNFYEALKFSGTEGRRRYKLTPVQCFIFANIYGFYSGERRLTRSAYIFVPRKFSKTTQSAAMAVYDLLCGDNNSQAYIGANSYAQAKICFDEVRKLLWGIDRRGAYFQINREKITFQSRSRDGLIECLSGDARTKDGLNASLVIMDEYAQARNTPGKGGADLKNTLTSSMGVRKDPLVVVITTASDVVDGPFRHELEGVLRILRGEAEDDSVFGAIYMPDAGDRENDPRTWRKVQPHLGITVRPEFYENEYRQALLSAENMTAFRTKLLNVFTVSERRIWVTADVVKKATRRFRLEDIHGYPDAMVALDLSESDDFSAVTFGIYDKPSKRFYFNTAYFFPRGALFGHPNRRLYQQWAASGMLHLTEGDVIDYRAIVDYVLRINEKCRTLRIGYDQWKSCEVINMLSAAGAGNVLRAVSQTYGNFTAPCESFEHGIKTGHIFIDDNPINSFCFGNAVLDVDRLENCKPIKISQTRKIDGVITTLMCMRMFIDYER